MSKVELLDSVFVLEDLELIVLAVSPLGLAILPPTLPQDSPSSYLMFGCEFLYLFPLVAGWSHSEDSHVRLLYASITVSLIVSGIGACPWDGSQVGLVIGWPFSQSLLHFLSLNFL